MAVTLVNSECGLDHFQCSFQLHFSLNYPNCNTLYQSVWLSSSLSHGVRSPSSQTWEDLRVNAAVSLLLFALITQKSSFQKTFWVCSKAMPGSNKTQTPHLFSIVSFPSQCLDVFSQAKATASSPTSPRVLIHFRVSPMWESLGLIIRKGGQLVISSLV